MEIKTKFNVGDDVYCVSPYGEIRKKTIHRIAIVVVSDNVAIGYITSRHGSLTPLEEDEVFATREEAEKYSEQKTYNNGKLTK